MATTSFLLFVLGFLARHTATEEINVCFVNVSQDRIQLYWEAPANADFDDMQVAYLAPGEVVDQNSDDQHRFYYDLGGTRHTIELNADTKVYLIGPDEVQVKCSTTTGDIHAIVKPKWSPRGAARFLQLVHEKYFDGCALNRVVKGFLTQFGISADYQARTEWRDKVILDDEPKNIKFQPGYMSYAGSGPNSRTTEMFIVMPDVHYKQLEFFGTNPWETPFGYVEKVDLSVVDKWQAYGDMPPWGEGPDPDKIYAPDGYDTYLKSEFPKLSYIEKCRVVPSSTREEEEL